MVYVPVATEIAAAKLLKPLYKTAETLYEGLKAYHEYADDYARSMRQVKAQYAIFTEMKTVRGTELQRVFDPEDPKDETTRDIINELSEISRCLEQCNEIAKTHERDRKRLHKRSMAPSNEASNPQNEARPGSSGLPNGTPPTPVAQTTAASAPSSPSTQTSRPSTAAAVARSSTPATTASADTGVHPPHSATKTWKFRPFIRKKPRVQKATPAESPSLDIPNSDKIRPVDRFDRIMVEDSVLSNPSLKEAEDRRQKQARQLERDAGPFNRLAFVITTRKNLETQAARMKVCNENLAAFLRLKSTTDVACIVQVSETDTTKLLQEAKGIEATLVRLHKALRSTNSRTSPVEINILLVEDIERHKNRFKLEEDYLSFDAEESAYYHWQKHCLNPSQGSELFVSESAVDFSNRDTIESHLISTEFQRVHFASEVAPTDTFVKWGAIRTRNETRDHHWLFKDQRRRYRLHETLSDLLGNATVRTKMTRMQFVRLSRTIASSYLHLMALRLQLWHIDLSAFKYYAVEGQTMTWQEQNPYILHPYLKCGIGQSLPDDAEGVSAIESPCLLIYELGIQLTQIALCETKPTNEAPGDLDRGRQWALARTSTIESRFGNLELAEIVRDCLQYREPILTSEQQAHSSKHLAQIILRLSRYLALLRQSQMGNTAPGG